MFFLTPLVMSGSTFDWKCNWPTRDYIHLFISFFSKLKEAVFSMRHFSARWTYTPSYPILRQCVLKVMGFEGNTTFITKPEYGSTGLPGIHCSQRRHFQRLQHALSRQKTTNIPWYCLMEHLLFLQSIPTSFGIQVNDNGWKGKNTEKKNHKKKS